MILYCAAIACLVRCELMSDNIAPIVSDARYAKNMSWAYIPNNAGREKLMRRRGWTVGKPVRIPTHDHVWVRPCCRPIMHKKPIRRAEQREMERAAYERNYPKITRELVEQRVAEAEAEGFTLVSFEVFIGREMPKGAANNHRRTVRLPFTGRGIPRSNPDSRCVPLGRHIFRAWWLVGALRTWLRRTS